jgi:hypothetical protein
MNDIRFRDLDVDWIINLLFSRKNLISQRVLEWLDQTSELKREEYIKSLKKLRVDLISGLTDRLQKHIKDHVDMGRNAKGRLGYLIE